MTPSVYLYEASEKGFMLYLGEFSTLEGISQFPPELPVELVSAGATSYKKYGWATENEFPVFRTVNDVIQFFEGEEEIGLINFEIRLMGVGILRTHDDGECSFTFQNKTTLIEVVKSVVPPIQQASLLAALLDHPGMLISADQFGQLKMYTTFEHYIKGIESNTKFN